MMVTQEDITWAKQWIQRYEAKAENMQAKAQAATGKAKAAYLSHAAKARNDAQRWRKTLAEYLKK